MLVTARNGSNQVIEVSNAFQVTLVDHFTYLPLIVH
jgi:hypothetical protein